MREKEENYIQFPPLTFSYRIKAKKLGIANCAEHSIKFAKLSVVECDELRMKSQCTQC